MAVEMDIVVILQLAICGSKESKERYLHVEWGEVKSLANLRGMLPLLAVRASSPLKSRKRRPAACRLQANDDDKEAAEGGMVW